MRLTVEEFFGALNTAKRDEFLRLEKQISDAREIAVRTHQAFVQALAKARAALPEVDATIMRADQVRKILEDLDPRQKPVSDEEMKLAKRYPSMFKESDK